MMPFATLSSNYSTIFFPMIQKDNHHAFPFIDQMAPDSPIIAFGFGESNPPCLDYPDCYSGFLPNSICDSLSCPALIELVESNNIATFQKDYNAFSGPNFACLAVSSRHSSLTSPPTQTPDPQRKNPAQNVPPYKSSHTDNAMLV
jgi:hypothetical protein